jgi:hypothetical protein
VIYEAIVKVTDLPLAKGSKILLFTVPECGAVSASLDAKRNKLNEFIKNDTRENVFVPLSILFPPSIPPLPLHLLLKHKKRRRQTLTINHKKVTHSISGKR